ncbi:DNA-binding transcriptional regulator, LysR family [Noviherbaspirillum humi]|uniref:DNA-binding transcriptional regulator, LysR family n=1 Tax=Noviherbaspirillum humi TaxID=1688639 RepID=A0A239IDV6_9BURK|nr:LysR family transcriptional regulator [Noviherbaspirillum humi]SNS91745.1 DNA-binding transcriptional regulator, LysR family [Noviherbaspirillum humi]
MEKFDLNLLTVALAIAEEKSVSRAAQRLELSQPAVSLALGKLRRRLGDELFVRTPGGMAPTPKAVGVIELARQVTQRVKEEVLQQKAFNPETSTTEFTIALSDIGEMVFLPKLLQRVQELAPHASIASVTLPASEVGAALESGRLDLAVGYFPDLKKNNFFQQRLFSHNFICLLRADHPLRGDRLTLAQFLQLGHAVVRAEGRSQEVFDRLLERKNIRRRVVLSTPHFMSIPFIVASSDLLVTVPMAVGTSFASFANIRLVQPPLKIPGFDLKQHWHRRYHDDARHQWLRRLVADLFKDDARWPEPPASRRQSQKPG